MRKVDILTPDWPTRADFEAWWRANVVAFNRLAVDDPQQWERIARKVEAFQVAHRA